MLLEMILACKTVRTLIAHVAILDVMTQLVPFHVELVTEGFWAVNALKGLLSQVLGHVLLKDFLGFELFAACFALLVFVVLVDCSHVLD